MLAPIVIVAILAIAGTLTAGAIDRAQRGRGNTSHELTVRFRGGSAATVALAAHGDYDCTVEVFDSAGVKVATASTDRQRRVRVAVAGWVPGVDASYTIRLNAPSQAAFSYSTN